MGEMYGHSWASQQGDIPNDTWIRGLVDLTPEQFAAGLRACLSRVNPFPPNLPEFRALCTGQDENAWERQCHRVIDPATLLTHKRSKEQTEAALASLRKLRLAIDL